MSSNAIDVDENVAYTFTVGDGSGSNYPTIYSARINLSNTASTPSSVKASTGSSEDSCNPHWGEYVSTSADPSDGLTFWSVGEYMFSNVDPCHGQEYGCGTSNFSGCGTSTEGWKTEIFNCKAGSGFCP